jgi:hypothetical protein
MRILVVTICISTFAPLALQGCATASGTNPFTNPVAASQIPAADPMLDHYIAWVPRDRAQTATVAEAMAHISLVNAREQTARQLCSGEWVINGEVTDNIGPLPARAPESAGGYPAWYYRISHRPGMHGCQNTDARKLYHTLRENLPEWMDIKTASTTTLSLLE